MICGRLTESYFEVLNYFQEKASGGTKREDKLKMYFYSTSFFCLLETITKPSDIWLAYSQYFIFKIMWVAYLKNLLNTQVALDFIS